MKRTAAALKPTNMVSHETRTLSHPLSDLHVLKDGDSYGIFNSAGNIISDDNSPDGFFVNDTRLVSNWRVYLGRGNLQVLSHSLDNHHVVSTSHLSCKEFTDIAGNHISENAVYIRREKFLKKGTLYEKICIENHNGQPIHIRFILDYHADFYDIFQIRGITRNIHGIKTDIHTNDQSVEFRYTGRDEKIRQTLIRFSEPPCSLAAHQAEFDLELGKAERKTLVISAGRDPGEVSEELFHQTLDTIYKKIDKRLHSWTRVKSDNSAFDEWIEHSRIGLGLLTTMRQTGLYPYAGIPWFSTPFGRDGIITALQMLWINPDIAKGVLSFLAEYQANDYDDFRDAEPGKILHEMREGEMANTGEVPFARYYGGIDTTPLFIILANAYFETTGDKDFLNSLWPSITAALAWMERDGDFDDDDFLEYKSRLETGLVNQGWKDSNDSVFHANGELAQPPIALCEVQAYAYAAYKAASSLSRHLGSGQADRYEEKACILYEKVNETFWSEELGCYALAIDRHKKPCLVRSSNNGHMLWCGIVPEERARKVVDMLMSEGMFTGWGVRTIAKEAVRYNPLSYHNGSVWPHDTAIAAAGMARYGFYEEAEQILSGLFDAAKDCKNYWLPELFGGFTRITDHDLVKYPAACTLQAWASGSVFMALQAALGLNYDPEKDRFEARNPNPLFLKELELIRDGKTLLRIENS